VAETGGKASFPNGKISDAVALRAGKATSHFNWVNFGSNVIEQAVRHRLINLLEFREIFFREGARVITLPQRRVGDYPLGVTRELLFLAGGSAAAA
jgi:hypothetical protein